MWGRLSSLPSSSRKSSPLTTTLYGPGTPGHENAAGRQGHYVMAESAEEAARIVSSRVGDVCPLDVQNTERMGQAVRYVRYEYQGEAHWRKQSEPCPHCGR